MTDVVWLASYPKSGNTWLRILIGCLTLRDDQAVDINKVVEQGGIASARTPFDNTLLIDSSLLTHDEIDNLRPALYQELARAGDPDDADNDTVQSTRFVKAHDAYTLTASGGPLLGGARAAASAIVVVRDPRGIAASLANHLRLTIDGAIAFLNSPQAGFSQSTDKQPTQFRQKLLGWSDHVASWLDQRDIPVHLLRYEDLQRDAAGAFAAAMRFAGVAAAPAEIARAVARADFAALQAQERQSGFAEWQDRSGHGRLFFRRGEAAAWRDELTPEQVARIEAAHAPMMGRLGYALSAAGGG